MQGVRKNKNKKLSFLIMRRNCIFLESNIVCGVQAWYYNQAEIPYFGKNNCISEAPICLTSIILL